MIERNMILIGLSRPSLLYCLNTEIRYCDHNLHNLHNLHDNLILYVLSRFEDGVPVLMTIFYSVSQI